MNDPMYLDNTIAYTNISVQPISHCRRPCGRGGPPSEGLQRMASIGPADDMYSKRLQKSAGGLQLYFYLTHYRPFLLFLFKCWSL